MTLAGASDINRKLAAKGVARAGSRAVAQCGPTAVLARIAVPERFPAYLGPVFKIFLRLPAAHSYFDGMLKKNGAYERRFARPFAE